MSYYILYSLPTGFSDLENHEAIKKECYFAAKVHYIDGNTVSILCLEHGNMEQTQEIQPGTILWLERLRYPIRFMRRGGFQWEPLPINIKNSQILMRRII